MALWLEARVEREMISEATAGFPLETGGVLLGYRHTGDVVVLEAVGPGPQSEHSRTGFSPDPEFQEQEIIRRFHETEGRIVYVGDWHSHPAGGSTLSRLDRSTLKRIATFAPAFNPTPLMTILYGPPWKLAAWQYQSGRVGWLRRTRVKELRVKRFTHRSGEESVL